jgi:hypothetical protein
MSAERCSACGKVMLWSNGRLLCGNVHCPGPARPAGGSRRVNALALAAAPSMHAALAAVQDCGYAGSANHKAGAATLATPGPPEHGG